MVLKPKNELLVWKQIWKNLVYRPLMPVFSQVFQKRFNVTHYSISQNVITTGEIFFGLVLSVANNTHTFAITVYLLEICNDDTFSRGCSSSKIHLLQLYHSLEIALKCKVILRLFVSNSFCLSLSLWVSCLVIKLLGRILSVALMNQYVFA